MSGRRSNGAAIPIPHQHCRYRVLVVEDIPTLRRAYTYALERRGHEVTAVTNGSAALAALDATATKVARPEIVIAEVAMPVLDGISMVRTMRTRGMEVPVLMLGDDDFLHDLALHSGADRFLAQPFGPVELLDAVAALAERGRASGARCRDTA